MVRHCWQTTVKAWPNPRSWTGPPQLGQWSDLVLTTGGATRGEDIMWPPLLVPGDLTAPCGRGSRLHRTTPDMNRDRRERLTRDRESCPDLTAPCGRGSCRDPITPDLNRDRRERLTRDRESCPDLTAPCGRGSGRDRTILDMNRDRRERSRRDRESCPALELADVFQLKLVVLDPFA